MAFNLIVQPKVGDKGEVVDKISVYNPDKRVKERIKDLNLDYSIADEIRNASYEEFNGRTLTEQQDKNQRSFNNYIVSSSGNPDEEWQANTRRPVTRNKVISIAAHITSAILFPKVFAQNANDEIDELAANTMQDIMEWSCEQSDYARKFVFGIIAALVNPGVCFSEGFAEVKRKIKEITGKDKWKEKEVIDEIFSGFYNLLVPLEELYIGNIYESNIQKQPFLITRRIIDYTEAKMKYGENEVFEKYVKPGVRFFYNGAADSFYESYDENLKGRLVEEIVYYNRYADLELRVINGVLLDDPDRPLQRADKKYPFAFGGYEPYDEDRFFYRRSLVEKMEADQDVIDRLYNMILDGTFLSIMPPLVTLGEDEVDAAVIMPGRITSMGENNKIEPITIGANLSAGLAALSKVEASLAESSQDPLQSGQSTSGSQTAFEVSRLEENARKMLGLFGKMISFLVKDFGELRLGSILQHLTVGQALDTMGSANTIKFRKLIIPDRVEGGKKVTKQIEFETEEVNPYELLDREEYPDGNKKLAPRENVRIISINPKLFRNLKYKVKIEPDFQTSASESIRKALNIEAYDRLIKNPLANQETVLKDFLLANYKKGDEDKYIMKKTPQTEGLQLQGANQQSALLESLTKPALPEMMGATVM
jgi:hypothetical protein